MQRKQIIVMALGLFAAFGAVQEAQAKWNLVVFSGTRAQVRAACVGEGRTYSEHTDFAGIAVSACSDAIRHTRVICGDDGECVGSYQLAGGKKPRVPRPAESLSSPSDSPSPAPKYDQEVPLDPQTDGPIIIN